MDGSLRKLFGRMHPGPEGAVWVHGWCSRIVRALAIPLNVEGPVPEASSGFLAVVSNHLSYLDILVYSAIRPFVMVSKVEVRGWPLIGWITAQASTIYVQRSDVKGGQTQTHAQVNAWMAAAYRTGLPVLFFPEGTTTDGAAILPFRRGLFNSVIADQVQVKTSAIAYRFSEANVGRTIGEDVCFVGDAEFAPHLFRALGLRGIHVDVRFGTERVPGDDRFALAFNARAEIVEHFEQLSAKAAHASAGAAYAHQPLTDSAGDAPTLDGISLGAKP